MRKRSKYRPKPVLMNPLGYVLEGLEPARSHGSHILDLKIKNHGAMANLTQGKATRADIELLISMVNIVEALYRLGFGEDYGDVVADGLNALHEVGVRGADSHKFILRAAEMKALNTIMELHDAQMDVITVKDLDNACEIVAKEIRSKKARPIVRKEKA